MSLEINRDRPIDLIEIMRTKDVESCLHSQLEPGTPVESTFEWFHDGSQSSESVYPLHATLTFAASWPAGYSLGFYPATNIFVSPRFTLKTTHHFVRLRIIQEPLGLWVPAQFSSEH